MINRFCIYILRTDEVVIQYWLFFFFVRMWRVELVITMLQYTYNSFALILTYTPILIGLAKQHHLWLFLLIIRFSQRPSILLSFCAFHIQLHFCTQVSQFYCLLLHFYPNRIKISDWFFIPLRATLITYSKNYHTDKYLPKNVEKLSHLKT